MWEFELSHASFHSSVRSDDEDGERCAVREGAKEKRLGSFAICLLAPPPPAAERTCDLEAKQIIIIITRKKENKNPSQMQVSKFSSFRVYCRKRGKTDALKFSRLSSCFSILLLGLGLLLRLRLLFVAIGLVVFRRLVLDR